MHPKEAKKQLGRILVARFYSEKEAMAAEEEFESIFKGGGKPQEIETITLKNKEAHILDLLTWTGLAKSRSDAKRLIQQGGVSLDDQILKDEPIIVDLTKQHELRVGKRRFIRVISKENA
jgi:tyrosyl-tRNA synthetase